MPSDAETRVQERPGDHQEELRLWLRLLTCSTMIESEIRTRLRGRFDVILLGQVLTETLPGSSAELRIADHAAMIHALFTDSLEENGALIIVEPALRDRTRHLHALRDHLLTSPAITLFAPCLHRESCPALLRGGSSRPS